MRAYQWTIISFVIFGALIFFIPPSQVWLIFGLNIVFSFIQNLTTPLQWTMFSDVVDYEEHRSGRRLDGWSFNRPVCHQVWAALGGAVVGWVLAWWITLRVRQTRRLTFLQPSMPCSP
ncbi:MFS transporter [Enterobacter hormaechei]